MDANTIFYANVDAVYRLFEHAVQFIQDAEPTERQKQILAMLDEERESAKSIVPAS